MRKYLDMSKKTFYLCSTNKKRSIDLKFKVMKAYEVNRGNLGVYYRTYVSNTQFNSYFRIDVNMKEKIFDVWFVEKYKANHWFSLDEPKRILNRLGYNLKEFVDFTCVECFIMAIVDMIKSENFREILVSTDFIYSYNLEEYNLL